MLSTALFAAVALQAQAAGGEPRSSLEGVSCFSMGVVRASPAAKDAGISEQALHGQVERAISKAGLRLLDLNRPESCLAQKDESVAFVNLALIAVPGEEQVALAWRLEVAQEGTLATGRKLDLVSWSTGGLVLGRPVDLPLRLWEQMGPALERLGLEYRQARERYLVERGRAASPPAPAANRAPQ